LVTPRESITRLKSICGHGGSIVMCVLSREMLVPRLGAGPRLAVIAAVLLGRAMFAGALFLQTIYRLKTQILGNINQHLALCLQPVSSPKLLICMYCIYINQH
jgi:hypothetical protein